MQIQIRKKIVLLFTLSLATVLMVPVQFAFAASSTLQPESVMTIGGTGSDSGRLAIAPDGSRYLYGQFAGTVDFNPTAGVDNHTAVGSTDTYVSKYTASGAYVFTNTFGGAGADLITSVTFDAEGNRYVGGYFRATSVDFNPGPGTDVHSGSTSWPSAFVSKYDAADGYQWTRSFRGAGSNPAAVQSVAVDSDRNVYIGGYYRGVDVDMDPGPGTALHTTVGDNDPYLIKYDESGSYVWSRTFGSTGSDTIARITVHQDTLFVAGFVRGAADLDPTAGIDMVAADPDGSAFLSEYDLDGSYRSSMFLDGVGENRIVSIEVDALGNRYIAGAFSNSIDFDFGSGSTVLTSNGGRDAFWAKYSPAGNLLSAHAFGASGDDIINAMVISPSGHNVAVIGSFSDTVVFPMTSGAQSRTSAGLTDVFAGVVDANGAFGTLNTFGGSSADTGSLLALFGDRLYASGTFNTTVTFPVGTTLTSAGAGDAYVLSYTVTFVDPEVPTPGTPTTPQTGNLKAPITGQGQIPASGWLAMSGLVFMIVLTTFILVLRRRGY